MKTLSAAFLVLATSVVAQQPICSQYGTAQSGAYTVNNNLWGSTGPGINGSQCTTLHSGSGPSGVAFSTTWMWSGQPNNVKSYANVGLNIGPKKQISAIGSIPTSVKWSCSNTNIKADVSYDIFTAANPNHDTSSGDYELMIWLAHYGGLQPIGQKVASATVNGAQWDLWYGKGSGTQMQTYSFVAASPLNNWSGDIKQFFDYLAQHNGFPAAQQYLLTTQFGTEPATGGQTTLMVSDFTASVA